VALSLLQPLVRERDDKVSFDDDVPLQRRMRAPGYGRSMASRPPPATSALRPASSATVWATVPEGSGSSSVAGDTAAAIRAGVVKVVTDAAAAKKAAEEMAEKRRLQKRQQRRRPPKRWQQKRRS
jgi:hypothetical protein